MASSWFDESFYLSAKAAYNNANNIGGITTWTVSSVSAAFATAGMTAEEHYSEFGWTEGLSPNAYYVESEYVASKVAQLNANLVDGRSNWTPAEFEASWGANPFTHYVQFGAYETDVEPSIGFDDDTYYADKAAYNNAQLIDGRSNWTPDEVKSSFQSAGLTPIGHYELYGATENFYTPTPTPTPGQVYTLTVNADTIPGTAGDDTIVAGEAGGLITGLKTLTAGDNINGAGGTNTINVSASDNQSYSGFTMQNVQNMNVTADGGSTQTFDLSGTTGLTTIASVNSSGSVVANQVTSLANVALNNLTGGAGDMTVQYQDAVVAGTDNTVAVALNNTNAGVVTLGSFSDANGGIETVAITATGADSRLSQLNSDLKTLTFTGDKNLTIGTSLNQSATTINAATATGGLNVTVGGIPGVTEDANVTFTGGSGNDQITFNNGTLTTKDSVTGGTGNDRLVASQANLIAAASKVSGMETIRVSGQLTGTTFNADDFADATTFELADGYNTATIQDLLSTQTTVNIIGGGDSSATTLTLDDAATSATGDTFTLGLGRDKTTTAVAQNVGATVDFKSDEMEIVNLVSNGANADTTGNNGISLTGTDNVTTLNITGTGDLSVVTAASNIQTIAGGDATGDLNLLGVSYKAGATITTGSGDDKLSGSTGADTISTGDGADTVYGTNGADTITVGAGVDLVSYSAVSQSSSAATDTITDFVSGTDILDISGLGTTAIAAGGLNKETFALAQGALTAGGVVSTVFEQDTNTLWVDCDGNGTLDSNDLRVVLSGVDSLDASSLQLLGAPIVAESAGFNTVTGLNMVDGAKATESSDVIQSTYANLNDATDVINGLGGSNTLEITDAAAALNLATKYTTAIANIQNVILDAGTTGLVTMINGALTVTNAAGDAEVALGSGAQTYTGSTGADTVTMSTVAGSAGQVVTGGAGADVITFGLAGQKAYGEDDADTFNASIATGANQLTGSVVSGGDGVDILALSGVGSVDLTGIVTSVETLDLTAANAQDVTLANGFKTLLFADAGDTVTSTVAQFNSLTDIAGATNGDMVISNTGSLSTAGITFTSALDTTTLSGGADTLTTTVGKLTSLGDVDAGAGSDTLKLTTAAVAATLDTTTNFETVKLADAANVLTPLVDTIVGAGQTLTIDDTASVTALSTFTFDGSAETDGHFVIKTGGANTSTLEGGQLSDTFDLAAGAGVDTIMLDGTTSNALNLDLVDTVKGFEAGVDVFDTGVANVAGSQTFSVTLDSTTGPSFVGDLTTALATAGVSLTATKSDAVLFSVSTGDYVGTYVLQDTNLSGTIDTTDYLAKVTGTSGNITCADFH